MLEYLNRTSFGTKDPQFHLDVSFYVFDLPFWRGIVAFASAVLIIAVIAALATSYLYGAIRLNGRELRISRTARIQIATTVGIYIALQAVSVWLDQYATVTSASAGFLRPAPGTRRSTRRSRPREILAVVAALVAILFFVTAVDRSLAPAHHRHRAAAGERDRDRRDLPGDRRATSRSIPSAQTLEAPYIQRNINATRAAYGVANVKTVPYNATTTAKAGALRTDAETTASIRILDPDLVSKSFGQLEQFKQYYQFEDHLDVDRYKIDGKTQDTVIAARELSQSGLGTSQSWYNNTIVYTHGYGVVAAYGNERTSSRPARVPRVGHPEHRASSAATSRASTSARTRPQYSIVGGPKGSAPLELDYPAGNDSAQNKKTTFTGSGGPVLGNLFTRLIYAIKFQSEDIVLSNAVNNDSQILYNRDPRDRVAAVAPYLTLDKDAYPAIVNGRIVWIVDGYTTTDQYPYSTVEQLSQVVADANVSAPAYSLDDMNYIRNSVKATVDAYSGKVTLYAWDPSDPLLKTWEKIFPATVKPESDMSTQLLAHVRYPQDLFKAQRAILGSYHVTDAASFYAGDDQWVTPNDPTPLGGEHGAAAAVLPDHEGSGHGQARVHAVLDVHPEQLDQEHAKCAHRVSRGGFGCRARLRQAHDSHAAQAGQHSGAGLCAKPVQDRPGLSRNELALLTRGATQVDLRQPADPARRWRPALRATGLRVSRRVRRATRCCARFWWRSATRSSSSRRWMPRSTTLFGGNSGATAGDSGSNSSSTPTPVPTGTAERRPRAPLCVRPCRPCPRTSRLARRPTPPTTWLRRPRRMPACSRTSRTPSLPAGGGQSRSRRRAAAHRALC